VSGRENIFNDLSKHERGKSAARAKECIFHFYLFAKNRLVLCLMMLHGIRVRQPSQFYDRPPVEALAI
jgi:hypothetical protein